MRKWYYCSTVGAVGVLIAICVTASHPNELRYNGISYDAKFDSIDDLMQNIYRYSEYVVNDDTGECYALELETEDPKKFTELDEEQRLDKLLSVVKNTEYTYDSSTLMRDGVNCQYMAVYIEKYCLLNGLSYSVKVDGSHVYTVVSTDTREAFIDFNSNTNIEVHPKESKESER